MSRLLLRRWASHVATESHSGHTESFTPVFWRNTAVLAGLLFVYYKVDASQTITPWIQKWQDRLVSPDVIAQENKEVLDYYTNQAKLTAIYRKPDNPWHVPRNIRLVPRHDRGIPIDQQHDTVIETTKDAGNTPTNNVLLNAPKGIINIPWKL